MLQARSAPHDLGNFTCFRTRTWKLQSKSVRQDEEDQLSHQQYLTQIPFEREPPTFRAAVALRCTALPGASLHGKAFKMLSPGHEAA